jgi:hypothetical protein
MGLELRLAESTRRGMPEAGSSFSALLVTL